MSADGEIVFFFLLLPFFRFVRSFSFFFVGERLTRSKNERTPRKTSSRTPRNTFRFVPIIPSECARETGHDYAASFHGRAIIPDLARGLVSRRKHSRPKKKTSVLEQSKSLSRTRGLGIPLPAFSSRFLEGTRRSYRSERKPPLGINPEETNA